MAQEVVCKVLCFIKQNFDKLTIAELKSVVCSFYKDDEVVEATEILL